VTTALRDLIRNPNAAELELVARYGMLPEDARRERAFEAFAKGGLPHRRVEGWRWSDIKAALPVIETPPTITQTDIMVTDGALVFTFAPTGFIWPDTLPEGIRMLAKPEAQAFGASEDLPLGALAAALSGGEKKRLEIYQMMMLEPKFLILDETDSGLDIDALKTVAEGVNAMRAPDRGMLVITHYQRLLDHIKPDRVHVMAAGRIVTSGGPELASRLEAEGYDGVLGEAV